MKIPSCSYVLAHALCALPKQGVLLALDRKDREREMLSQLLALLHPRTLSEEAVGQGFTELMLSCEVGGPTPSGCASPAAGCTPARLPPLLVVGGGSRRIISHIICVPMYALPMSEETQGVYEAHSGRTDAHVPTHMQGFRTCCCLIRTQSSTPPARRTSSRCSWAARSWTRSCRPRS